MDRVVVPGQTVTVSPVRPVISIIVPFFNEELVIDALRSRLIPVLEETGETFEIICVNDGSHDKTAEMLDAMCAEDRRFKGIHFSRNFGHQAAVTAGLHFASGDCAIIIDADLQDPPELIEPLVAKWREGFEVVYALRRQRAGESLMKRATAFIFYRTLARLTDLETPVDTGDFCLLDRKVIDVLNAMPEQNRYLRGLRVWVGFRHAAVPFDRRERYAGETKYHFKRMVRLAIDGIFTLSHAPHRLAVWLGFSSAAASLVLAIVLLVAQFAGTYASRSWAAIFVAALFLGGLQLISIGVIVEYTGRIYDEVKRRPLYIVAQTTPQ
jgi:dolichol-phosphate mannosyltransferase